MTLSYTSVYFTLNLEFSSPVITSLPHGMGWVLEGWVVVGEEGGWT